MILGVRAYVSLSGITSRTRQTHRTPEPCPQTQPPADLVSGAPAVDLNQLANEKLQEIPSLRYHLGLEG
jgi:hypothetical protein